MKKESRLLSSFGDFLGSLGVIKKKGITRVVLLIGPWAIKFPRLGVGQINFLQGCLGNLMERQKTRWGIYWDLISSSLWVSWGGFVAIQKKAKPLGRPLTRDEFLEFSHLTADCKPYNFGILEGKIVCVDYGDL